MQSAWKTECLLWRVIGTLSCYTMYGARIHDNQKNSPYMLSFFNRLNSTLRMASIFSLNDISQAYNFKILKKKKISELKNIEIIKQIIKRYNSQTTNNNQFN